MATGQEMDALQAIWETLKGIAIFVLGIFGYGLKREVRAFDELKKDVQELKHGKVDEDTLNNVVGAIRSSVDNMNKRMDRVLELLAEHAQQSRRD